MTESVRQTLIGLIDEFMDDCLIRKHTRMVFIASWLVLIPMFIHSCNQDVKIETQAKTIKIQQEACAFHRRNGR